MRSRSIHVSLTSLDHLQKLLSFQNMNQDINTSDLTIVFQDMEKNTLIVTKTRKMGPAVKILNQPL